jgi:hypothetical protein
VPSLPNVPPSTPVINLEGRQTSGQLTVPVDKSQLLHVDQQFGEISVGNKDIADVVPLSRNLIYVLGKKRGATNLTISDQAGNVLSVVDCDGHVRCGRVEAQPFRCSSGREDLDPACGRLAGAIRNGFPVPIACVRSSRWPSVTLRARSRTCFPSAAASRFFSRCGLPKWRVVRLPTWAPISSCNTTTEMVCTRYVPARRLAIR